MNPSSQELIRTIESRNRKYRIAFVSLMAIVILVLVGVVALQYRALQKIEGQSAERARALKQLQEENLSTAGRTNAYIQCLARFFAETDRAGLTIEDLDKCSIERNGTVVPGVDKSPTVFQSNGQPLVVNNYQTMPGLTPVQPGDSDPEPQNPLPDVPAVPDPFRVLGVPVCVPFTNVCVR